MKKIILLLSCIAFISCFKEPKKEFNINTKTEDKIPKNESIDYPTLDTVAVEPEIDTTALVTKEIKIDKISLKTLESILKMEENTFVEWCITNQYIYDELKYYEYFNVLYYKKPNISCIGLSIAKSELSKPSLLYNTNNEVEYNRILKECHNSNYNFIKAKPTDIANSRVVFEIYANSTNEASFYLSDKIDAFKYNIAIKKL